MSDLPYINISFQVNFNYRCNLYIFLSMNLRLGLKFYICKALRNKSENIKYFITIMSPWRQFL